MSTAMDLIKMTARIVSCYAQCNRINVADLPRLIQAVHTVLNKLDNMASELPPSPAPAVSVETSIRSGSIACLECGKRQTLLKRHLRSDHELSPEQYRARWKLSADYPLVAPDYAARRRDLGRKAALGWKRAAPTPPKRQRLGIRTPK